MKFIELYSKKNLIVSFFIGGFFFGMESMATGMDEPPMEPDERAELVVWKKLLQGSCAAVKDGTSSAKHTLVKTVAFVSQCLRDWNVQHKTSTAYSLLDEIYQRMKREGSFFMKVAEDFFEEMHSGLSEEIVSETESVRVTEHS